MKSQEWIDKLKGIMHQVCEWFELLLGVIVIIGLVVSFIHNFCDPHLYEGLMRGQFTFFQYLEKVFNLIIGLEFIQMLCKPNSENVIEVLIFLVARHLILMNTNSFTDFLAVIAVCILCLVRRYLYHDKKKYG